MNDPRLFDMYFNIQSKKKMFAPDNKFKVK